MMEWHYSLSAGSKGEIYKQQKESLRAVCRACSCKGRFPRSSTLGVDVALPWPHALGVYMGIHRGPTHVWAQSANSSGKKAKKVAGYPSKRSLQKCEYAFENVCYHLFSV